MLAWIHQTVASEFEILHSFASNEAQEQLQKHLDSIFDGVSHQFHV